MDEKSLYSDIDFLARLINGAVTLGCGIYILRYFFDKNLRHTYNLLWSLGFILWGVTIVLRTQTDTSSLILPLWIASGVSFIFGTSLLIKFSRFFLFAIISYFPLAIFLYQQYGQSLIGLSGGYYSMLLMIISSIMLRARIGRVADLFVIGWLFTLFTNILLGFNLRPAIVDASGLVAKLVFLLGISSPRIAYAAYNYEQSEVGREEAVILTEEKRRALAREVEKEGLYGEGGVGLEKRFRRSRGTPLHEELSQRLLQSFLDVVIASKLTSVGEVTGYEIVLFLHRKYGVLYSPGTVYPILHGMEKRELIKSRILGHRKPYVLTDKGRQWYEINSKEFPDIMKVLMIG